MKYYITDGHYYIMKNLKGSYVPIANAAMADEFDIGKAKTIIQNMLPKKLKATMKPVMIDTGAKKDIVPLDMSKRNSDKSALQDKNITRWIDRVSDVNGLVDDMKKRIEDLNNELSLIDKETVDIEHYIEFGQLNACQGYKVSKMLQDRFRQRRKIKDELVVITKILGLKVGEISKSEVEKSIMSLDDRKYRPRVLEELFM